MTPAGEHALAYAGRGWRVFPILRGDKKPAVRWKTEATTEPATIAGWFTPDAVWGLGIATGDGLVVLDVDPRKGGRESLAALQAEHGSIEPTLTVHTGGQGLHYYFAAADRVANSVGRLGAGLDVRGEGGYVVAPPSLHASGVTYRFALGSGPMTALAPAPLFLTPGEGPVSGPVEGDAIRKGARNVRLTALAGRRRREGASRVDILAEVRAENRARCRPPLDDPELEAIADSVCRYDSFPGALTAVGKAIEAAELPGRGGLTQRDVLRAHLRKAEAARWMRAGKLSYSASVREVAEMASVDARSVRNAHARLVEAGWLCRVGVRQPKEAQRWTLQVPAQGAHPPHTSQGDEGDRDSDIGGSSGVVRPRDAAAQALIDDPDIWRWRGLGKAARRDYSALASRPAATAADIASVVRLKSPAAIRRRLAIMEQAGLVARLPHGAWLALMPEPAVVAAAQGVSGLTEAQIERHRRERIAFEQGRGRLSMTPSGAVFDPETGEVLTRRPDPSADLCAYVAARRADGAHAQTIANELNGTGISPPPWAVGEAWTPGGVLAMDAIPSTRGEPL